MTLIQNQHFVQNFIAAANKKFSTLKINHSQFFRKVFQNKKKILAICGFKKKILVKKSQILVVKYEQNYS